MKPLGGAQRKADGVSRISLLGTDYRERRWVIERCLSVELVNGQVELRDVAEHHDPIAALVEGRAKVVRTRAVPDRAERGSRELIIVRIAAARVDARPRLTIPSEVTRGTTR